MGHVELEMSRVIPEFELQGELTSVGTLRSVTLRPPDDFRPHQVFEIFPNDQRLLVKLPSCWKPDDVVTAYYQADDNGILQPLTSLIGPVSFFTWQCMSEGLAVFLVLCFFTILCVLPYVLLPAVGLALLSTVPIIVFAVFVRFQFADSVRILQMITSFFEAIAWFIPFTGIILIIYFPVGWQDWVDHCDGNTTAVDFSEVDGECVGKRAIQSYLMTAFLEELLKFLCVRRLLWFAFVSDPWALCCYGGAAGLGFAALENVLYVGTGGLTTALLRAGTAVPNHLAYGLLHGAFLSQRRFSHGRRFGCCNFALSPGVPMLLHGSHNFSIALCQHVNFWLGLSIMAVVAVATVIILRLSIRQLGAVVNVHELIDAKVIEAPACCLCCQGICGWPVAWPPGAPVMAELDHEWRMESPSGLLQGLGDGTFELLGGKAQEVVVSTSLGSSHGKVFLEIVIDQTTEDFRIGLRQGEQQSSESWMLGPAGLFCCNQLVEARPVAKQCNIGCLLDWDDGSLHFQEDGRELVSTAVAPGTLPVFEWRVTGRLMIRLAHFQQPPKDECQPLQVMSDWKRGAPGPVVGQVVGVILSDSEE